MEHSDNDETRRKAALDVLRLTGLEPGNQGTFLWGIDIDAVQKSGELTPKEPVVDVEKEFNSIMEKFQSE